MSGQISCFLTAIFDQIVQKKISATVNYFYIQSAIFKSAVLKVQTLISLAVIVSCWLI